MSVDNDIPPNIDMVYMQQKNVQLPTTKKEIADWYATTDKKPLIATIDIFKKVQDLRNLRETIDLLTEKRNQLENEIANYMQNREKLISADGEELVQWSYSKDSKKFNEKQFKSDNPELYNAYLKTKPGNRSFLLKNKT